MLRIFFVFLLLDSVLLCFGASAVFVWNVIFIANANKTTGIVVDVKERKSEQGNPLFCPVVEYVDDTGKQRTFSPNSWQYPSPYEKGDSVSVAYHRNKSVIDDFTSLWLLPLILFIVGLGAIPILAILVYVERSGLVRRFFPDNHQQFS